MADPVPPSAEPSATPPRPSRRRRRRVAASAILVLGIATLGLWFAAPGRIVEPEHLGRPARAWLLELEDPRPGKREAAMVAIRFMGTNLLPVLGQALRQRDPWLRRPYHALAERLPRPVRGFLWDAIRPEEADALRRAAATAAAEFGPIAAPLIAPLERRLRIGSAREASPCLAALVAIGPEALPAFRRLIEDPDAPAALRGLSGLPALGTNAIALLPSVVQCYLRGPPGTRDQAVRVLTSSGPAALPALLPRLADPEAAVRRQIEDALVTMIEGDFAHLVAVCAADPPDAQVRRGLAETLRRVSTRYARAAVRLAELLADPDPHVRVTATEALREHARLPRVAVPLLRTALAHAQADTRRAAALVLGAHPEDATACRAALERLLEDPEPPVAAAARAALALPTSPANTSSTPAP